MIRKRSPWLLTTAAVCTVGCAGSDGPAGAQGKQGTPGAAGGTALVRLDAEPAGGNCANGGTAIHAGIDSDANGTLDNAEITSTAYVCEGNPGQTGGSALVRLDVEPAGSNCANGGTAVHTGIDTNDDSALQNSEITTTAYVCNGAAGATSLIRLDPEPAGTNCAAGGTAVHAGVDIDGNDVLDDNEISSTAYVCNALLARRAAILVLQVGSSPGDPTDLTRIDRDSGTVGMTISLGSSATAVVADPDGTSFWVGTGGNVERRSIETGTLLNGVPLAPMARDLVVVSALDRLYVAGYEKVGVIDLGTNLALAPIALQASDQTLGIASSPDGSEVVQLVYNGGVFAVFINTGSNTVSQRLAVAGFPTDVVHLGSRVVVWDDNGEEFRFYDGSPWAETVSDREAMPTDFAASANAMNNMTYNPVDQKVYVFRAATAEVARVTVSSPTVLERLPMTTPYTCFVFDMDSLGLEGIRYPPNAAAAFEHMALPAGTATASSLNASALPSSFPVVDLEAVTY